MTPKAYRLFQSKLLTRIFEQMQASRSGRHQGPIVGEGATEMQQTRPYEFGDSVTHMDIPASFVNALLRSGSGLPVRLKTDDIVIHQTRNNPKCASAVLLDMSGSMRYDGMYINVKRMGLALDGLIRTEYPGDFLQFIELYTFAKPRHVSEVAGLMPKPVTIYDYMVRAESRHERPESLGNAKSRRTSRTSSTACNSRGSSSRLRTRPTARSCSSPTVCRRPISRAKWLYLLYPPDPRTENATLREAQLCAREGITINIFLLSSWNQTRGGRALRLPHGGVDEGPRLLHGRPRPGPLRRLGLHCPAEADYFVSVRKDDGS